MESRSLVTFSVIMPVRNGEDYLKISLPALRACTGAAEIIVVDDDSADGSASVARRLGARVVRLSDHTGAAAARNQGVCESSGEILVFVDSDVQVGKSGIQPLIERVSSGPYSAVFGSYDDAPEAAGFISQYANLRHHYYHQHADGEAETFWAGFGAVRRTAFEEAGGFDPAYEGVEDIALGYRLRNLGYRIILDSSIQATHLKRWTLWRLAQADIFYRAVPWSRLRMTGVAKDSLNLNNAEKGRALAAAFLLVTASGAAAGVMHWMFPLAALTAVGVSNVPFGAFMAAKRGLGFAIAAVGMHQVYYLYASAAFALVCLKVNLGMGAATKTKANRVSVD